MSFETEAANRVRSSAKQATIKQRGETWKGRHAGLRKKLRETAVTVEEEARLFSQLPMRGVNLARAQSTVELGVASLRAEHGLDVDLKNAVIDVSQDVLRSSWRLDGCPTQTTSSEYFLCGRGRVAIPEEHLLLLGFDHVDVSDLSSAQVKELAAEAMAVPTVATCLMALIDGIATEGPPKL